MCNCALFFSDFYSAVFGAFYCSHETHDEINSSQQRKVGTYTQELALANTSKLRPIGYKKL